MKYMLLTLSFTAACLCLAGCAADKPEVTPDQYGNVVSDLPNLPDLPKSFELPEGADQPNCTHKH